jgi:histidine triad (HIT) family protein
MECIFCKIIAGQIPSCKIYEDGDTVAFMDIGPIVKGHALVVPKRHYADITDTPADVFRRLMATAQMLALAQKRALKADGVNIMQSNGRAAGQVVDHIHVHIIPRFNADGHHWNWKAQKYADNSEMQGLAEKIKNALSS